MTDGDSQRICGIVWFWQLGQLEKILHHVLDLLFLCMAEADERLLYLHRGVFADGEIFLCQPQIHIAIGHFHRRAPARR